MELLGHLVILCLTFWGVTKLFFTAPSHFMFPPTVHKGSRSPDFCQHLLFSVFNSCSASCFSLKGSTILWSWYPALPVPFTWKYCHKSAWLTLPSPPSPFSKAFINHSIKTVPLPCINVYPQHWQLSNLLDSLLFLCYLSFHLPHSVMAKIFFFNLFCRFCTPVPRIVPGLLGMGTIVKNNYKVKEWCLSWDLMDVLTKADRQCKGRKEVLYAEGAHGSPWIGSA